MDARDLLIENLDLVDRVVAFTCRRQRLDESEADDFAATVKLKLVENDYAILRKFEGRSSFSTFLTVVVSRMLLDYRIHAWGKWHPSAEAKRIGDIAVEIEKIVIRDGRTIDEAATALRQTREAVEAIAARLPPRAPKRKLVDLDEASAVANPDAGVPDGDRVQTSRRVSQTVRGFIATLPEQDRLILQLRFDSGMTVAQIARSMNLDQKHLYRRLERHLRGLRAQLEHDGIAAEDAAELIGETGVVLDFRFGNGPARPSTKHEDTITTGPEEVSR